MKKLSFLALAAAVAAASPAFAQGRPAFPDPYGDATVSKADAAKSASDRFDQLDTNHDGTLSAEEIEAASSGPGGRGLRRADADGDGKVTKDEFMTAQQRRFDMMDADHDGQLTKAERDAFRAQMMQRMQERGGNGGGGWGGSSGN